MSQVKVTDERLEAELRKSTDTVMVHGSDGRFMGLFTPDNATMHSQISEEELLRREEDTNAKTFSTEEILVKLRAL